MRIAQDQVALPSQKPVGLPIQRIAGVGATVDEARDLSPFAHGEEFKRPDACPPLELAAARVGEIVEAAEFDSAGAHAAFRRSSAALRVMMTASTMAGMPAAEA